MVARDPSGEDCLVRFNCHLARSKLDPHNSSIRECHYQCVEVHRENFPGTGSAFTCDELPRPPIVTERDSQETSWWGLCGTPPQCPRAKQRDVLYYQAAGGPWGGCSRSACRKNCGGAYENWLRACDIIPNDKAALACKVAAHVWYATCIGGCNAICKNP